MKRYLTKKRKTSTDFYLYEVEGKLLHTKYGKVGKVVSSLTSNLGSEEAAISTMNVKVAENIKQGFVEDATNDKIELLIFDKAKWHLNADFPSNLSESQAYVHTGLFIGWLIIQDLIDPTFKKENELKINKVKERKITGPQFYMDELDGVFSSDEFSPVGIDFSKFYFDFKNGQYIKDYEENLAGDLPTIFHVKDNWRNFDKIREVIDIRFKNWKELQSRLN